MRDDDELRLLREFPQEAAEAHDIRLVERRVDLVEHREGRRPVAQEGEEQGNDSQRALAARERGEALALLLRQGHEDVDARVEHVLLVEHLELCLAAAEEAHEDLAEVALDV